MTSREWVLLSTAMPEEGAWATAAVATLGRCDVVQWVGGAHQLIDMVGDHIIAWWKPAAVARDVPAAGYLEAGERVPAGTWWTDITINDAAEGRALAVANAVAEQCDGRLVRRV